MIEVLWRGRDEDVEAEIAVGGAGRDLVGTFRGVLENLQVRDDRPALLAEPGLVEAAHVLAVQQRGGAQHLVHGDDAGAADAHHENISVSRDLERGLGQRLVDLEDATRLLLRWTQRHDRDERWTVALQARVVLVAG